MYCEDMDVCLERVRVQFAASHMASRKKVEFTQTMSRSHCLALGGHAHKHSSVSMGSGGL